MMKKQLILILILLSLLLGTMAGAATVSSSAVGITTSTTGVSTILLDIAPAGLSGGNFTVAVNNTSVATISSISFDSWASPHSNSAVPASSVTFTEADFGNLKQNGATNIVLAYITVFGSAQGTTTLNITVTACDDDVGTAISPTIVNGTLTVTSPPPPVSAYPVASFTCNKTYTETSPATCQFNDTSYGAPTAWVWNFGDGNTSTLQNPNHTYATPGWYTVTLNATNIYGSNVASQKDLIHIQQHYTRATASATIAPISTRGYGMILDSFGGNKSPANETEAKTNWTMLAFGSVAPFMDTLGPLFPLLIIAIPFILIWLATRDLTLPCIVGILICPFLIVMLPSQWHIIAAIGIGLGITAVIYTILTRRE